MSTLRTKRVGAGDDCWATTSVACIRFTVAFLFLFLLCSMRGPVEALGLTSNLTSFIDKRETGRTMCDNLRRESF